MGKQVARLLRRMANRIDPPVVASSIYANTTHSTGNGVAITYRG